MKLYEEVGSLDDSLLMICEYIDKVQEVLLSFTFTFLIHEKIKNKNLTIIFLQ